MNKKERVALKEDFLRTYKQLKPYLIGIGFSGTTTLELRLSEKPDTLYVPKMYKHETGDYVVNFQVGRIHKRRGRT